LSPEPEGEAAIVTLVVKAVAAVKNALTAKAASAQMEWQPMAAWILRYDGIVPVVLKP
jgi:hypothetical protein